MTVHEGDRYYDPAIDAEFTVTEVPDTRGLSTMERDRLAVTIKYDGKPAQTVPHDRFRGRTSYEKLNA